MEHVLVLERIATANERVATALEHLLRNSRELAGSARESEKAESKCLRAMRLLAEWGPDDLARIAEAVGVNRRTLNKWPAFMEAKERMVAARHWTPREPRAARPEEL